MPADVSEATCLLHDDYVTPNTAAPAGQFGFTENCREKIFYIEAIRSIASNDRITVVANLIGPSDNVIYTASDFFQIFPIDLNIQLVACDPEDDAEQYECTSEVYASHPVPQIELEITSAAIDSGGNLQVEFSGVFIDRMSEVVTPPDRMTQFTLEYMDEVFDTVPVAYGAVQSPSSQPPGYGWPWKLADSTTAFVSEITIPDITPGIHIFKAVAGPNFAGETGQALVYVFVDEIALPPLAVTNMPALAISFPVAPSTSAFDTAYATFGAESFTLDEADCSEPDIWWVESSLSGDLTFAFGADSPLSQLSPDAVNTFTAFVTHVESPVATNFIAAVMVETGTNTLAFEAVSFYEPEAPSALIVYETGELEGTPTGCMEPFVAQVKSTSTDFVKFAKKYFNTLNISVAGEDLEIDDRLLGYLSKVGNGTVNGLYQPRLFTPLADSPGTLPYESWSQRDIVFTVTDAGGHILREFHNTLTDPSFGGEGSMTTMSAMGGGIGGTQQQGNAFVGPMPAPTSSTGTPSWTVKEAKDMYRALYGAEAGELLDSYTSFGGTVEQAKVSSINPNRKSEGIYMADGGIFNEKPLIRLDPDCIKNTTEAAFELDRRLNGLIRPDFHRFKIEEIQLEFGSTGSEPDEVYAAYMKALADNRKLLNENLANIAAALDAGVKISLSLANGALAIVIDMSDVIDAVESGKYGQALFIAGLSSVSAINNINKGKSSVVVLKTSGAMPAKAVSSGFDDVLKAADKFKELSNRDELMKVIADNLKKGKITTDDIGLLYKNGKIPKGRNKSVVVKSAKNVGFGETAGIFSSKQYHHVAPVRFEQEFIIDML